MAGVARLLIMSASGAGAGLRVLQPRTRVALLATPVSSEPIAPPIATATAALATCSASSASTRNGMRAAAAVLSPTIQLKNRRGWGVLSRRRCSNPVASKAAAAANTASQMVLTSPHDPSPVGPITDTSNSPLAMSTPTMAMSAATSAVAAPPVHSRAASTARPGGPAEFGASGGPCRARWSPW